MTTRAEQEPQAEVVVTLASQPVLLIMSQSPKPASHIPSSQTPMLQTAPAFMKEQAIPHMEQ